MNYFFLLDMSIESCNKYIDFFKIIAIIQNSLVLWIGIVLPLIMIIIGIISLIKAIISKKEIKKCIKKLFKNILLATLIFFTIITIDTMSRVVACDIYYNDGIEYQQTGCCMEHAREKITKKEARMFDFLLAAFVISFVFNKKSGKTVEKSIFF